LHPPLFDLEAPSILIELEQWITSITKTPLRKFDSLNLPIYNQETLAEIEKKISPAASLTPSQSIAIYNQQYWFRLLTFAQENFPTLVRLFGYSAFNQSLAEPSIIKYPPDRWALWAATIQIPRWIKENYEEQDKILVLQLAELDAIYHSLLYAPFLPELNSSFESATLQPFVKCFTCHGDLFTFRKKLLSEEPEYWIEHEFPEIQFSKPYFFSFYQKKENIEHEEISEIEFEHLKNFEASSSYHPPALWLEKWGKKGWLGQPM
jgi:hypothetical protein